MHKKHLYIFLFFLVSSLGAQSNVFKKQLDSIHKLRQLSKSTEIGLETRITYAKQAVALSKRTDVDSVFLRSNWNLSDLYLENIKYYDITKNTLHENLKLANKLKDSYPLTYINAQLGQLYHIRGNKNDSAYYYYYNALKYFKNASFSKIAKHKITQPYILNNIAFLQKGEQDYLGSQTTTIQAINLALTVPDNKESQKFLSNAYISLGLNLQRLKEYNRALEYFQKSMDINKRIPSMYVNMLYTKINIAELYKETGDYKKVFNIYDELLQDPDLFKKDPSSYGAILCNIAYTKFLAKDKNTAKIDSLFTKAHNIFEDLKLDYELSASSNDMSEFYQATNEKEKALFYA